MRKGSSFVLFVLVLAALVAGTPTARAEIPILALDGRGFGHGVGLSQWGAKYAADAGATVGQILSTFYPGTAIASQGGAVRVAVLQAPAGSAQLQFPQGGELHSPRSGAQHPGFPVVVPPGGTVTVAFDGAAYVVSGDGTLVAQAAGHPVETAAAARQEQLCLPLLGPCTTTPPDPGGGGEPGPPCGLLGCTPTPPPPATDPPPPDTAPPATDPPPVDTAPPATDPPTTLPAGPVASPETVWAVPAGGGVVAVPARGRSYRGSVQAVAGNGLRLVNELDVEAYLKGMGEVPSSWPAAAQEAQAVAARTYALRAMAVSGEICDTDRCQVYVGAGKESAGQSAAVDATAGQVLTYGGALATAVYSADAGGFSANTYEGFGTPDGVYPYLTNVPYSTPDPLPWHVDIALSDLAARFSYPGSVTGVRVARQGPSGRVLELVLDGTSGPLAVDGRRFASRLGLRSTLFSGAIGTSSIVPPPPPDGGFADQALPDDAAALAAAAAAPTPADGGTTPSAVEELARLAAARPIVPDGMTISLRAPTGPPVVAFLAVALLALVTALAVQQSGGAPAVRAALEHELDRRLRDQLD